MSKTRTPWLIALLLWMAASTYWHTCKIKELCDAPVTLPVNEETATMKIPPLKIEDGNALLLTSETNFAHEKSKETVAFEPLQNQLDSLVSYLKANPSKKLNLTGYYASSETNPTKFENLGIARAEFLKDHLVKMGLPADRITTEGKLNDSIEWNPAGTAYGLLDFGFTDTGKSTEENLAQKQKFESVFKPMDLYFQTGSLSYIKTPANAQFLKEAKQFLQEHPDKKLLLTGHTDNVGSEESNLKLSKKRAEELKSLFAKSGISPDQLLTDAKGESSPKATNDTPEGRKENRRVAIVIQ